MLLEDNSLDNPLGFSFPPSANSGRVAFASLGDVDIGQGQSRRLTTLRFSIPNSEQSGGFATALAVTEAKRGFITQVDILSEFSAANGTLQVAAAGVPEPSGMALTGAVICSVFSRRRRQV